MVDKKTIKNMGTKTRNFCRGFLEGHLAVPSFIRKTEDSNQAVGVGYFSGGIVPAFGHFAFGFYPLTGYFLLFNYNKKIAIATLATQVTTNIASGIYEWYRYERDKLNKPLTTSPGELEKIVEPKIEVELKPNETKFINPWEIEIPKMDKR